MAQTRPWRAAEKCWMFPLSTGVAGWTRTNFPSTIQRNTQRSNSFTDSAQWCVAQIVKPLHAAGTTRANSGKLSPPPLPSPFLPPLTCLVSHLPTRKPFNHRRVVFLTPLSLASCHHAAVSRRRRDADVGAAVRRVGSLSRGGSLRAGSGPRSHPRLPFSPFVCVLLLPFYFLAPVRIRFSVR